MPAWTKQCPAIPDDPKIGCAALWPIAQESSPNWRPPVTPSDPPVVLFTLFKNVRAVDLVRFLEYHLLLGVNRAVLVDNSCGAHANASRAALAPYVAANLVTHHTQFVCTELRSMMFMHNFRGGSSMARQLSGLRDVPAGAFVVSLDDDEYVAMADARATLRDLRHELVAKRVCALTLTWRVYGASGHECQPAGPLVRRFVRRALAEHEVARKEAQAAARHEALTRHLNTPYGGKPLYLYRSPTQPMCGTHWCDECPAGEHNCALPQGAGASCEKRYQLTPRRFWINHYAFQSLQHWEAKKLRGRTNQLPSRTGGVPRSYDRMLDPTALQLLEKRIALVPHAPLRVCLGRVFADEGNASAAPSPTPRLRPTAAARRRAQRQRYRNAPDLGDY